MKNYVHSVEDALTSILGGLDDNLYDNLNEEEFNEITKELSAFGDQFVFIESIHNLSLNQDGFSQNILQIVSFTYPKRYLCIRYEMNNLSCCTVVNSKEEVLEELHDFVNTVPMLTFNQADTINEIIEFYS